MSDVLITRDGPYDAPYSYELGAREAFEPTTVEALVDGAGAGGSFKIVCVIRSPDGKVLARVPTSETFSPGDEVAVTFAPFLRAFASAGTAATFRWCRVILGADVPSGSIDPGPGTTMTIASFDTNDFANYQQIDATTWQIAQVPTVLLLQLVPGPAGTPRVTNGDVVGLIRSAAGGGTLAFAGNGVKVDAVTGGKILMDSFEWTNAFRGELRGNETGSWFVNAYFGTVF